MSFQVSDYLQTPDSFILVTERLVVVPTPIAIRYNAYIQLYGGLHASEAFCQMAFGPHFTARKWSDDDTRDVIFTRDMGRCWKQRGMGDFAVALRKNVGAGDTEKKLQGEEDMKIAKGADVVLKLLEDIEWIGYAGVRDATTTSMPDREAGDEPLPPWQEMVELRYGVHEKVWGKGVAGEAARAVMQWAVTERGVRRFLAETEKTNVRSAKVLRKMGFRASGTDYWKEPSEMEWEKVAI